MWRIIFLTLILFSSITFVQAQEQPKAIKVAEFEAAVDGEVKMWMDSLWVNLGTDPTAQGYIINYGTAKEIALKLRQIQKAIYFLRLDGTRITIVKGGFQGVTKTEFWIVPAGAENPQPESDTIKFDEFGKVNSGDLKVRLDGFLIVLQNNPNQTGYIVNYGSTTEVAKREKAIKSYLSLRKADLSKINILKGGVSKIIKTELWVESAKSTQSKK